MCNRVRNINLRSVKFPAMVLILAYMYNDNLTGLLRSLYDAKIGMVLHGPQNWCGTTWTIVVSKVV